MSTTPEKPFVPPPQKSSSGLIILLVVIGAFGVMCFCCAPALILPAISAAREAARQAQCKNNLRQVTLAMHNYHTAHGVFPPAYVADAAGQPLYSWRVLLLPYLEQQNLFDQFDLEKAWDSPENLAVSEMHLPIYHCPSRGPGDALTNYVLVTGPQSLWDGAQQPTLDNVEDGPSSTVMLVEVRDLDIHWAEPRDLTLDEIVAAGINGGPDASGEHAGCGSYHSGGMNVALFDGSVHFFADTIDPEVLRALLTPAGGEAIDLPSE